jgi:hypothetical protein
MPSLRRPPSAWSLPLLRRAARRPASTLALATTLALTTACGSRSDLLTSEPPAEGTGGTTSTPTTTTGAGGAGAGGADPLGTCDVLVLDGPPRSPEPAFEGWEQAVPWLTPIEASSSRVALSYLEAKSIPLTSLQTSSVAIDTPWGAWPDALGASAPHTPTLGFVAGPGSEGRLSLLTSDEPNNAGQATGMVVWFPPAGIPGAEGQYFDDLPPGAPTFVTAREGEWLAGFQRVLGDGLYHLSLARITSPLTTASFEPAAGCATFSTLSAAAVPFQQGFLLATSSGRPYGKCLTDDLTDGPPSWLHIVRLPGSVADPEVLVEYSWSDTYVFQVHAIPAATGTWLAWERLPFAPPYERTVDLVQLDGDGYPVGEHLAPVPGEVGVPFALAALGDRPVVAGTRQDAGGSRVLDVRVLTEQAEILGQITLTPDPGYLMDASVQLLGSPAGDRLLVAWAESPATAGIRRVRVARLACAGGL